MANSPPRGLGFTWWGFQLRSYTDLVATTIPMVLQWTSCGYERGSKIRDCVSDSIYSRVSMAGCGLSMANIGLRVKSFPEGDRDEVATHQSPNKRIDRKGPSFVYLYHIHSLYHRACLCLSVLRKLDIALVTLREEQRPMRCSCSYCGRRRGCARGGCGNQCKRQSCTPRCRFSVRNRNQVSQLPHPSHSHVLKSSYRSRVPASCDSTR